MFSSTSLIWSSTDFRSVMMRLRSSSISSFSSSSVLLCQFGFFFFSFLSMTRASCSAASRDACTSFTLWLIHSSSASSVMGFWPSHSQHLGLVQFKHFGCLLSFRSNRCLISSLRYPALANNFFFSLH